MNVSELIEKLKKLEPNAEVLLNVSDSPQYPVYRRFDNVAEVSKMVKVNGTYKRVVLG